MLPSRKRRTTNTVNMTADPLTLKELDAIMLPPNHPFLKKKREATQYAK